MRELKYGVRHTEMRRNISLAIFDSVKVALERFHTSHGHYPKCEGKYFLDSLKPYITVSDVYVYADSLDPAGINHALRKPVGNQYDWMSVSHTYIGVSRPELSIVYRFRYPDTFLLYWVGENGIDENGRGDDLVYKK